MLVRNRPLKSDALAQSKVDVTTCNSRREYSSILSSAPIYPWEAVKNVPFHLFWSMHQVSVHVSPKCYPKCSAVKRPRYYICLFYAPLLSCISCWEPLFFPVYVGWITVSSWNDSTEWQEVIDTSFLDQLCLSRDTSILFSMLLNSKW